MFDLKVRLGFVGTHRFGFIHHASLIHGNQKAALQLACRLLDIQAVMVE